MKTIKNWQQFNEGIDDPNKVLKIRKGYEGKDTDVELLSDITGFSVKQVIDIIRHDLKHADVADELESKFKGKSGKKKSSENDEEMKKHLIGKVEKKPRKKIEPKSGKRVYFEMTGSPRSAMAMLPPKERTKDVFATELEKHGFKRSSLNKQCDMLIAQDLDIWTNKMKKAEEMGVEVTTYAKLIKEYKLFKNSEGMEYDDEVGKLELWWNGEGPSTWFFITDAIKDGIIEEKLQLDDDMAQGFAEYLYLDLTSILPEIEEDAVEWFDLDELSIMIEQDFEETLDKLFNYLMEQSIIDKKPTVEIKGEDEDGEEWELSYFPE